MPEDGNATDPIVAIHRDLGYLNVCGAAARRWLAVLCDAEAAALRTALAKALGLVRSRELEAAQELYDALERQLRGWAREFPSHAHVMERHRLAGLAYFDYLSGDLAAAKAHLLDAHRRIELAIGCHEFLMPLAIHCPDFIIQRARIARRERDWGEAQRQIAKIRDIHAGVRPFCVLDSGRGIGVAELRQFFAGLALDDEQRQRAAQMIGDGMPQAQRIELLEELVYALPNMVIPYP